MSKEDPTERVRTVNSDIIGKMTIGVPIVFEMVTRVSFALSV
jgi:hypothetical protein